MRYRYTSLDEEQFITLIILGSIFGALSIILSGVFASPVVLAGLALAPVINIALPLCAIVGIVSLITTALISFLFYLSCRGDDMWDSMSNPYRDRWQAYLNRINLALAATLFGIGVILTGIFAIPTVVSALSVGAVIGVPLWAIVGFFGLAASASIIIALMLSFNLANRRPVYSATSVYRRFHPSDNPMRRLFLESALKLNPRGTLSTTTPLSAANFKQQFDNDKSELPKHLKTHNLGKLNDLLSRYIQYLTSSDSSAEAKAQFHYFVYDVLFNIFRGTYETNYDCLATLLKGCVALASPVDSIDDTRHLWNLKLAFSRKHGGVPGNACLQEVFAHFVIASVYHPTKVNRKAISEILAKLLVVSPDDFTRFQSAVNTMLVGSGITSKPGELDTLFKKIESEIELITNPSKVFKIEYSKTYKQLESALKECDVESAMRLIPLVRQQYLKINYSERNRCAKLSVLIRQFMDLCLSADQKEWSEKYEDFFYFLLDDKSTIINHSLDIYFANHIVSKLSLPTPKMRAFLKCLGNHMDEDTFNRLDEYAYNAFLRYPGGHKYIKDDAMRSRLSKCLLVLKEYVQESHGASHKGPGAFSFTSH